MRRVSLLFALSLVAVACAPTPPVSAGTPLTDCELRVRFGSYASGIDREALDRVRTALQADARTAGLSERPWGREGERDLCVAVRTQADARALVETARTAIPARSLNGYVDIDLAGERVFSTQQAR